MARTYILFGLFLISVSTLLFADDNKPTVLTLKPSPRLWVTKDTLLNLKDKLHTPEMKAYAKKIIEDADLLVKAEPIGPGETRTNQHGTRLIASHLQCLTAAWALTRDQKYRKAAIKHLKNILNWNQISCEANSKTPAERKMFFCLSYGEHAADIALMYDFFRQDITPEEQKVFFDVLDKFYLKEALRAQKRPPWWANKEWSNWNGVCAGGMGMLALAFYDDRPECRVLIPFVEKSLGEYFKSFIKSGGGCHEGTGYWNYGMHYAMRYILSWENATGKKHPILEIEELKKTLHFPMDFTGITFGDNDGWHPTGMFFLLAKRLNEPSAALRAAAFLPGYFERKMKDRTRLSRVALGDNLYAGDAIPSSEEMEKLKKSHSEKKDPVARVYDGLGWGSLADDSAFPSLRLSARGGSSKIAGHGHMDLLSFKCSLNGEKMICDQKGGGYSSVTFGGLGHELYSRSAASKSTIFVDGLPFRPNSECNKTEVVNGNGLLGIRIDGSRIFHSRRGFIGRLFLMVENRYWLIIDTASGHSLESRFHTYADFTRGNDWLSLKSGKEQLMITFASLGGGGMQESRGMPTNLTDQSFIFRWMSSKRKTTVHVTALNPGSEKLGVEIINGKNGELSINVTGQNDYKRTIKLSSKLELVK